MDPARPSYEEMRDTINRIMNTDTSDVKPPKQEPKMADMKEQEGQDPQAEMPPVEEATQETAPAGGGEMTMAQLAEKIGVEEQALMEFIERQGLAEKVGGIDQMLMLLAQDPQMLEQFVQIAKSAMGAGDSNSVPMIG